MPCQISNLYHKKCQSIKIWNLIKPDSLRFIFISSSIPDDHCVLLQPSSMFFAGGKDFLETVLLFFMSSCVPDVITSWADKLKAAKVFATSRLLFLLLYSKVKPRVKNICLCCPRLKINPFTASRHKLLPASTSIFLFCY